MAHRRSGQAREHDEQWWRDLPATSHHNKQEELLLIFTNICFFRDPGTVTFNVQTTREWGGGRDSLIVNFTLLREDVWKRRNAVVASNILPVIPILGILVIILRLHLRPVGRELPQ